MKLTQRLLALGLCAALLLPLCACRYSDVMEQIIYDLLRDEIDRDAPFHPEDNNPEHEDTSDDLKDLAQDDEAERFRDESPELLQQEEETEDSGQSVHQEYQPDAVQDGQAHIGENAVTAPEAEPDDSTQAAPEDAEGPGEDAGGVGEEGESYEGSNGAPSVKQVVDAYGKTVEIPENVDKVTATGELAIMVMMLDGAGRLAASNTGLIGDGMAERVFSGLSGVSGLWSGSGNAALSADSFQTLLDLRPDVVLEFSGSGTVTDSQAAALREHGIAYLVLPQPTSAANIRTIMTTLGAVLGDRSGEGGANAPQAAADYISWVDRVTGQVSQAVSPYESMYTLYVDGWDDEAYYRLYNETYVTMSGYGCAVVQNGATVSCKTLTSYLGVANVVNTAARYGITPNAQYFTPLISYDRTMEVTGPGANGMFANGQKLLELDTVSLGTAGFPILLAADRHTKQAIEESRDSGSGVWTVYPHINTGDSTFNSDGFLDEEGNLVRTQISGAYEVVVNPSGVSSWVGGSAESVLESVWAAWRFFGAVSEDDMRACVSDFYSQFYGYTLSDAELDSILEGQ